jgi:hypothetical protein
MEGGGGDGLGASESAVAPVAGCGEHGNEPSSSMQDKEFLD